MRAVVQRVSGSSVLVGERVVGEIGAGLLALIGVSANDTEADADYLADKIAGLRIFEDEAGKMNLGVGGRWRGAGGNAIHVVWGRPPRQAAFV